ncbi:MAG TPA: hypothetical protein VGK73_08620 [Polyangiaceae bacterium]
MFIKRSGILFNEAPAPDAGAGPSGGGAPAVTPPAPGTPPAASNTEEPPWLPGRLDQAKKSERAAVLKGLGFASEAELKAALDAGKAAQAANQTQAERDAARIKELEPLATKATVLETTVKGYADKELAGLTEAQRVAVAAIAGDDPARILTTIEQLRPTWAASAPAAPATPPVPAPASTTPAGTPAPPKPATPDSPRSRWEALKKTDATAASIFYQTNRAAIEAAPA